MCSYRVSLRIEEPLRCLNVHVEAIKKFHVNLSPVLLCFPVVTNFFNTLYLLSFTSSKQIHKLEDVSPLIVSSSSFLQVRKPRSIFSRNISTPRMHKSFERKICYVSKTNSNRTHVCTNFLHGVVCSCSMRHSVYYLDKLRT